MYEHKDILSDLKNNLSLSEKLKVIHHALKDQFSFIDRIAVASYDAKTNVMKSFIDSSGGVEPLAHYSSSLKETSSLQEILKMGRPRVINDLTVFDQGKHEHTIRIRSQGYSASYTMPMYLNSVFWGFIFFNSYQKNCFSNDSLKQLDVFGHLISCITTSELVAIKTVLAALKTANDMVHYRDPETGNHLDRMARYSRLIAQQLAIEGKYKFNDEYIEHIFLFAPLHDIGKISIADKILLKPDRLNEEELKIMQTHSMKGYQMIDSMLKNFDFQSFNSLNVLCNIVEYHHEALDGSGYPMGLKGNEIPIEARIIAVADIFDALTSSRPYKPAWSNEEAFSMLKRLATTKLDQDCVNVFVGSQDQIEELQTLFKEETTNKE